MWRHLRYRMYGARERESREDIARWYTLSAVAGLA